MSTTTKGGARSPLSNRRVFYPADGGTPFVPCDGCGERPAACTCGEPQGDGPTTTISDYPGGAR